MVRESRPETVDACFQLPECWCFLYIESLHHWDLAFSGAVIWRDNRRIANVMLALESQVECLDPGQQNGSLDKQNERVSLWFAVRGQYILVM